MKKIVFTALAIMMAIALSACGATGYSEATQADVKTPVASLAENVPEPAKTAQEAESAIEPQATKAGDNGNERPTISGLGIDQGNYSDDEAGVKLNIQSTAWGGTSEDVIMFTASKMYDAEFSAKILYPDKIYEIHFGDGMWYQYNPDTSEIIDPWFDVHGTITELTGEDAITFSDGFVSYIDGYCVDTFGYKPEELIYMKYE